MTHAPTHNLPVPVYRMREAVTAHRLECDTPDCPVCALLDEAERSESAEADRQHRERQEKWERKLTTGGDD